MVSQFNTQSMNYTLRDANTLQLSPALHPPLASLSLSRVNALQQVPNEELKAFIEGDLLQILSSIAQPAFSNGSVCAGDTVADISWLLRTLMPEAPSAQCAGITTGENVIRGAWAAIKAWERFQEAHKIHDTNGKIESGIDVIRGITQSTGGGAFLAYRGLMIAADIQHVNPAFNATTLLGKAAFATGAIGSALFSIFFVAISAWSAFEYYETAKFRQGIDACGTDEELLKFFEKKVIAGPMAKLGKSTETAGAIKENYSNAALDAMTDLLYSQIESLCAEAEEPPSKDMIRKLIEGLFYLKGDQLKGSDTYKKLISSMGLKQDQIGSYDFSFLELLGFKLEEMNHQRRKDAKLSRVGGGPQIKKALSRGLGPRLSSDNELVKNSAIEELAKLKTDVTSENTKNKVIFGLLLAVGVVGIASSVLGFFPVLAAAAATTLIVVTLLLCLGMLGADGYLMYSGWGSGMPGRYDKHYLVFLSVMIISIVALAIGTTLAFGLPILPLIFTCVFGAVGLGLCGVAFDEVNYKEKKWKWEHPDLETFNQSLLNSLSSDDEFLDAKMTLLFKKLPKSDRISIRKKYIEMSGNLQLKTEGYRKLDRTYDFGGEYFNAQTTLAAMNNEREHALLLRGIKKTLRFYWEKWAIEKTEESKMIALETQALFEAVSKKNAAAIKAAVVNIDNKGYYSKLKEALWYVVKREESKKDLMSVVQSVVQEKKAALDAQQPTHSLKEHFVDILKSA